MRRPPCWHCVAHRSLAGRPVALASSGEALELPCVHARQPILAVRGRWADPRVAENMGVTQGVHVRPILVDPCAYLISSADGPVAGDEDIDGRRPSCLTCEPPPAQERRREPSPASSMTGCLVRPARCRVAVIGPSLGRCVTCRGRPGAVFDRRELGVAGRGCRCRGSGRSPSLARRRRRSGWERCSYYNVPTCRPAPGKRHVAGTLKPDFVTAIMSFPESKV